MIQPLKKKFGFRLNQRRNNIWVPNVFKIHLQAKVYYPVEELIIRAELVHFQKNLLPLPLCFSKLQPVRL